MVWCSRACHPCGNQARMTRALNLEIGLNIFECIHGCIKLCDAPCMGSKKCPMVLRGSMYFVMFLFWSCCCMCNTKLQSPWILYPRCVNIGSIQHGSPEQNTVAWKGRGVFAPKAWWSGCPTKGNGIYIINI